MTKYRKVQVSVKVLLPRRGETIAVSETPKVSALCFDRIWGYSDDDVPKEIRCFAGTQCECELAKFWTFAPYTLFHVEQLREDGKEEEIVRAMRKAMRENGVLSGDNRHTRDPHRGARQ